MKKNRFFRFISLIFTILVSFAIVFSSCSSSRRIKKSEHKKNSYKTVQVKQAKWNTTTSTSTTYYLKKQKQPKRYDPTKHHK